MRIEFLYWDECPSHDQALARLREVLAEEGIREKVQLVRVDTDEQARAMAFPGSPTIRLDGADIVPPSELPVGLACRIYLTDDGRVIPLPTKEMIRRALRAAVRDRGGGSIMIPFALPATDGRISRPEDFAQARVFGVIFTCNHCPYAQAWEDRLIRTQRDYADRGVRFVLISANDPARVADDSPERMRTRAQEKAYPFPYLFDETQEVAKAYGATRTPEIFLFDAARVLRYHGAPDDNYEDPGAVRHHYLRDAIEAVLTGATPATAETKPVECTIKWK